MSEIPTFDDLDQEVLGPAGKSDDERDQIIKRMVDTARNYLDADVKPELDRAWRYYGKEVDATPMGFVGKGSDGTPQFEGSRIVISECADTVNTVRPDMMRVFAGSDEVVEYEPNTAMEVEPAKQATDYANDVVWRQNDGAILIDDCLQDWLIKFCAVRVWWDEEHEDSEQAFDGIDQIGLQMLVEDESVIEIDAEPYSYADPQMPVSEPAAAPAAPIQARPQVGPQAEAQAMLAQPQQLAPAPVMQVGPEVLYRGRLVRRVTTGKVCVRRINQRDVLVDGEAETLDEARILGTDRMMLRSDVLALGVDYDIVDRASSQPSDWARRDDREGSFQNETGDKSQDWIRVVDARVRIDMDDDGVAEDYMVLCIGEGLEVARFEPDPKSSFMMIDSPYRKPGYIIGSGVAENMMDLQDQMTAYHRRLQDSLNRSVAARWLTDSSDPKTMNDLVSWFGGPVRVNQGAMVTPLSMPFVGQSIFPYLEQLDQRRVLRTGISPASQGLDPNVLKGQTVEAAQAIVTGDQDRLDYLVRRFADGIFRPMFQAILKISVSFQDRPTIVRLRGSFVPVDPRQWNAEMQVSTCVGLGTGTSREKMAALNIILQNQMLLLQQGSVMVDMTLLHNTLSDICSVLNVKNVERYFHALTKEEYQKASMDKQAAGKQQAAEQVQQQIGLLTAQERASAQAKAEADMLVNREKIAAQAQADQLQAQTDLEKTRLQLGYEAEKDAADRALQLQMKQLELAMKRDVELARAAADHELAMEQARQQPQMPMQEGYPQ